MLIQGNTSSVSRALRAVPIRAVEDKRQITINLPIQLVYSGKTKQSLPKFPFSPNFSVTFTKNHWSNTEKFANFFEEIIFPYLEDIKRDKGYPSEQHSLIIMDSFKGQDNDTLRELCGENNCDIVIVHHKPHQQVLTYGLISKKGSKIIQNKYND